jgi:hypothetical protein
MLNQLKWDAKDSWMRYGWIVLAIPLTFLLVFLTSNRNTTLNHMLITSVTGMSGLAVFSFILLGNLICLNWLLKSETQLHVSVPIAPWKILTSKLLLAAIVNIFTCLFALQVMIMSAKFSIGSFRSMSLQDLAGIPDLVLLLSFVNMTSLFCNLLARSVRWTRDHNVIFMMVFIFVILLLMIIPAVFATYSIWSSLFGVLILLEFFGSIVLMNRFAHLD